MRLKLKSNSIQLQRNELEDLLKINNYKQLKELKSQCYIQLMITFYLENTQMLNKIKNLDQASKKHLIRIKMIK